MLRRQPLLDIPAIRVRGLCPQSLHGQGGDRRRESDGRTQVGSPCELAGRCTYERIARPGGVDRLHPERRLQLNAAAVAVERTGGTAG